jgi:hypothetical protein
MLISKLSETLLERIRTNKSGTWLKFESGILSRPLLIPALFDALTENTTITSLDFDYCGLGMDTEITQVDICKLLKDFLKKNTTVTNIDLQNNGIKRVGFMHLVEGLRCNTSLRGICLEGNSIQISDIEAIIRANPTITIRLGSEVYGPLQRGTEDASPGAAADSAAGALSQPARWPFMCCNF